jgi:hypothetical protein
MDELNSSPLDSARLGPSRLGPGSLPATVPAVSGCGVRAATWAGLGTKQDGATRVTRIAMEGVGLGMEHGLVSWVWNTGVRKSD